MPAQEEKNPLTAFPEHSRKLLLELEKITVNRKITSANISSICLNLMVIVETYPNLTGSDKKLLVLETIESFVNKKMMGKSSDYPQLIFIIQVALPMIIDMFIGIDKNNLKIHAKGSIRRCLPCLK